MDDLFHTNTGCTVRVQGSKWDLTEINKIALTFEELLVSRMVIKHEHSIKKHNIG